MAPQPETVLLACEHKFRCIVGGETFLENLEAVVKAHADSECPCTLSGFDRAWISLPSGPDNLLPDDAVPVSMGDVVDSYEPPMVWFGSAWDAEPTEYALANSYCKKNPSISSGPSSNTFIPRQAFITVRPGLLRCGVDPNIPMSLPPSQLSYTHASRLYGVDWIDKSEAMDNMDRLGAPLSLIRRPSGFGKTSFAMMTLYYHSPSSSPDMLRALFEATKIKSSPHGLPDCSGRLCLFFDLAKVSNVPVEKFKYMLQLHVQSSILAFMGLYGDFFGNMDLVPQEVLQKNGFFVIEGIRHLIGPFGWRVYVVIDNYNAPARAYDNNTRVTGLIDSIFVRPLRDLGALIADGLILGEYMSGDDGDYRYENEDDDENWIAPHPWNKISEDYTRHRYVNAAFGLSVDEIAWLCKAVSPEDRLLLGKILQDVRGYQFGPDVRLTYGIRDVIDAICVRTDGGAASAALK